MFNYQIYRYNSQKIFKKVCAEIIKAYSNIKKNRLHIDVDCSAIQEYRLNGKEILVFDDYYTEAVYIKSEVDLSEFVDNFKITEEDERMYCYTVCAAYSEEYFFKACKALEERVPGITRGAPLYSMEDDRTREYSLNGNKIAVYNDNGTKGVYIESEVNLDDYLYVGGKE